MLEWVCPKCDRAVDPAFEQCPFCRAREAGAAKNEGAAGAAPAGNQARRGFSWANVDRGFRFGLGVVAVLALVYFLLFAAAYILGNDDLLYRLVRWLPGR